MPGSGHGRRHFLSTAGVTVAAAQLGMFACTQSSEATSEGNTAVTQVQQETGTAIRPFPQQHVPESELTELRRRINATRWPTRELVKDDTQGVQLAMTQALARYWGTDYDWRKCEANLNAIPQFVTEIDGQ